MLRNPRFLPAVAAFLVAAGCGGDPKSSNLSGGDSLGGNSTTGSETASTASTGQATGNDSSMSSSNGGASGSGTDAPQATETASAGSTNSTGTTTSATTATGSSATDASSGETGSSDASSGTGGLIGPGGVLDITIYASNDCTFTTDPASITVPEGTEFTVNWINHASSAVEVDVAKIDQFNQVPILIGLEIGNAHHDEVREWCGQLFTGTFNFRVMSCSDGHFIPVDCGG